VGLASINQELSPIALKPEKLETKFQNGDIALSNLNTQKQSLTSLPGDEYKFTFKLPKDRTDYELFLKGNGYYIEWTRESWVKEKDKLKLFMMLKQPAMYLKSHAEEYKKYEQDIEKIFWSSKIHSTSLQIQ
jgi:hypothetical protein